jgi:hypothetical protein
VQQRQLFSLCLGKRVLEPIRQRCRQRPRPSLARLVLENRFARLKLAHEGGDLRSALQPVAQCLPHQHGQGERIALREAQQWPPVSDVIQPPPALLRQLFGHLYALAKRHRRKLDARRQLVEPIALGAPRGQQKLRPAPP